MAKSTLLSDPPKKRKKRRRTCKTCGDVNLSLKDTRCIACRAFPGGPES